MLKKQTILALSLLLLLSFASVAEANQWLGGNLNMPTNLASCNIYTPKMPTVTYSGSSVAYIMNHGSASLQFVQAGWITKQDVLGNTGRFFWSEMGNGTTSSVLKTFSSVGPAENSDHYYYVQKNMDNSYSCYRDYILIATYATGKITWTSTGSQAAEETIYTNDHFAGSSTNKAKIYNWKTNGYTVTAPTWLTSGTNVGSNLDTSKYASTGAFYCWDNRE